jgi:hypothetical protein
VTPDFPAPVWLAIATAGLLAFIVRGLAGFGASMIGIGTLSLWLPPAQVVPGFLAIEVLATAHQLPGLWRQIDWRSLRWVLGASALATPLGTTLLARLPAEPMRVGVSGALLVIAVYMLWRQASGPRTGAAQAAASSGRRLAVLAGGLSGLLNGAVGISGPPVIVLYFSRTAFAVGRASLIAYFLFSDTVMLGFAGLNGLLTAPVLQLVLAVLPFALVGVWLGQRLYLRLDEDRMRRTVWLLLAGIGAVGLLRAASGLVGS